MPNIKPSLFHVLLILIIILSSCNTNSNSDKNSASDKEKSDTTSNLKDIQPLFSGKSIKITVGDTDYIRPINAAVIDKSIQLLNLVFNLPEFKDSLQKYSFICTNKPSTCNDKGDILGDSVYADLFSRDSILINLKVKRINPLKKLIYGTLGQTNPLGNTIITYTYWLKNTTEKELIIMYAAHIGHEIFHTKYYRYIHDPEYGSRKFINDRDVTYKIDDILEALITKNYR